MTARRVTIDGAHSRDWMSQLRGTISANPSREGHASLDFAHSGERAPSPVTCLLILAIIFIATTAHASIVPTALTGRVTSAGKPVADATVTVNGEALPQPRSTTTTPNGMYWLEDLPPGVVDVTFAHAGMTTLTRRAVIELAQIGRADATLEASEDEDSVTSTATTISVADTQPLTAHVSDREMDALPIWRTPFDVAIVAATFRAVYAGTLIDDVYAGTPYLLGQEALEEVTVVRAAAPPELDWYSAVVAKTRYGGDAFRFSLRDTLTSVSWDTNDNRYNPFLRKPRGGGVDHFIEAAASGPIVRDRLWFFASVWRGGQDDRPIHNVDGYDATLTSQLGAGHTVHATYMNAKDDSHLWSPLSLYAGSQGSVRYTGVVSPITTFEANVARSATTFNPSLYGGPFRKLSVDDSIFAKATHVWTRGSREAVLSGGVRATQSNVGGSTSLFLNSRWSFARLLLNAGGRVDRGGYEIHARPRLSAAWDLRGDGRRAWFAAFSNYADPRSPDYPVNEAIVGYAAAIGASGTFRVDAAHRRIENHGGRGYSSDVLHVESSYRLFEQFVAGGVYEYVNQADNAYPPAARHVANAWLSAELPLANHTLGVTLLERFTAERGDRYDTDLALRYTIPVRTIALTTAVDVVNALNSSEWAGGRTFRAWVRVRL